MVINDLQLKLEVVQKTLDKKRQTSKYSEANLLSSSSVSTAPNSNSTLNISTSLSSSVQSPSISLNVEKQDLQNANDITNFEKIIKKNPLAYITNEKSIDTINSIPISITSEIIEVISSSVINENKIASKTSVASSPISSNCSSTSTSSSPSSLDQNVNLKENSNITQDRKSVV